MNKNLISLLVSVVMILVLSGCSKIRNFRGYIPDGELVAAIRPEVDTKETVEAMLGNPTMKPTFDDNNWYYYNKTTESWAFFPEKVIDMNILAISFDSEGYVTEMRRYTAADNKVIDPVSQKTVTHGKDVNFFAELFGNIGRFGSATNSPQAGN